MKKYYFLFALLLLPFFIFCQTEEVLEFPKWAVWIKENLWLSVASLLATLDVIVRLTPTEKDNNILRIIQSWLDFFFPNRKKDGGTFTAFSEEKDKPKAAYIPPCKD